MSSAIHSQAITYYNPDGYPPIVNSARLMAQHGFTLDLLCRDTGEDWGVSYHTGVNVERIKNRGRYSWQEYTLFVRSVLRRGNGKAAFLVGHDAYGLLPARLLATRYRRPLVYHCHDFIERDRPLHLGGRVVRAFEQIFARTADLVIVPDTERGNVIARELALKHPPLIVANAPLNGPQPSGEALRKALSERDVTLERIVFRQGRIGASHAIEPTLRSMPYWENENWGFVVMGPGDPLYLKQLLALAQALSLERRFVILPPVGYDQVAAFTAGADLGHALYEPAQVNWKYITTASNKIMEYMAAGVPLLVSDRPGLQALAEHYQCGIIADESNPHSIAIAINTLLGDPARARQMGAAGRQAFEEVFCYERQFAPALDVFRALAARSQ